MDKIVVEKKKLFHNEFVCELNSCDENRKDVKIVEILYYIEDQGLCEWRGRRD